MIVCKQCGCIDNFRTEKKANNTCAFCNDCGSFIKNIPTEAPKMYVGKYKGIEIERIDDKGYLQWAHDNMQSLNNRQREAIKNRIYELNNLYR
jgi:hypothetical protein